MLLPLLLTLGFVLAEPTEFELIEVAPEQTAEAAVFELLADDWARPRSGDRVVALPGLRDAAIAWLETPDHALVLRYPGGESGSLWSSEVRDWLVALGIPYERIVLRPGGAREYALILQLEPVR